MSPDGPGTVEADRSVKDGSGDGRADEESGRNAAPSDGTDTRSSVTGRTRTVRRLQVAFLATALATVAALLVGPVGPLGESTLRVLFRTNAVGLSVLLGYVVFTGGLPGRADSDTVADVSLPPPSDETPADGAVVGTALDRKLGARPDAEPVTESWEHVDTAGTLRSLAVDALGATGTDADAARDALATGTWTDDPRAAAYFSGDPVPLRLRARDWLAGERERRQVEAVLAELRDYPGVGDGDDRAGVTGDD
jgi:hypothetical protein